MEEVLLQTELEGPGGTCFWLARDRFYEKQWGGSGGGGLVAATRGAISSRARLRQGERGETRLERWARARSPRAPNVALRSLPTTQ